jgi:uncharacterized membrane-anchored protein
MRAGRIAAWAAALLAAALSREIAAHAWAAGIAEPEPQAAAEAEGPRPVVGPKRIELGDDLVLDLPAGMGYFGRAVGATLMAEMGNGVDASFRGLVVGRDANWLVALEYVGDGYIEDADAADLRPDDVLRSIQRSTAETNAFRKQQGFPAVRVEWAEPPRYDRAAHSLAWGIKGTHDDGTPASVNFYTRVLGRRGFFALNLIDDPETIEASKADGLVVLHATAFAPGARYGDFDARSDKVAAYGLEALVRGGGAAARELAKGSLLARLRDAGERLLSPFATKEGLTKKGLALAGVLIVLGAAAWARRRFARSPRPRRAEPDERPPPR